MVGTPEGHVKSISTEEATPVGNLGDETKGDTMAPPRMGVEQLKARKREIEEAGIQLVQECTELDLVIEN